MTKSKNSSKKFLLRQNPFPSGTIYQSKCFPKNNVILTDTSTSKFETPQSPPPEEIQLKLPDISGFMEYPTHIVDSILDESGTFNLNEFLSPSKDRKPLFKPLNDKSRTANTLNNQKNPLNNKPELQNRVEIIDHVPFQPHTQSDILKKNPEKFLKYQNSTKNIKANNQLTDALISVQTCLSKNELDSNLVFQFFEDVISEINFFLRSNDQHLQDKQKAMSALQESQLKLQENHKTSQQLIQEIQKLNFENENTQQSIDEIYKEIEKLKISKKQKTDLLTQLQKDLQTKQKEANFIKNQTQQSQVQINQFQVKPTGKLLTNNSQFYSRLNLNLKTDTDMSLSNISHKNKYGKSAHNDFNIDTSVEPKTSERSSNNINTKTRLLVQPIDSQRSKITKLHEKLKTHFNENSISELSLYKLKAEAEFLSKKVEEQKSENTKLKSNIEQIQNNINVLRTESVVLKSEFDSFCNKIAQKDKEQFILNDLFVETQSLFGQIDRFYEHQQNQSTVHLQLKQRILQLKNKLSSKMANDAYLNFDNDLFNILKNKLEANSLNSIDKILDVDEFSQNSAKTSAFIKQFHEKCENFQKIKNSCLQNEDQIKQQISLIQKTPIFSSQPKPLFSPNNKSSQPIKTDGIESIDLFDVQQNFHDLRMSMDNQVFESRTHLSPKKGFAKFAQLLDGEYDLRQSSHTHLIDPTSPHHLKSDDNKYRQQRFINHSLDPSLDLHRLESIKSNSNQKLVPVSNEFFNSWESILKDLSKFIMFIIKCSSNFANLIFLIISKLPPEWPFRANIRSLITQFFQ